MLQEKGCFVKIAICNDSEIFRHDLCHDFEDVFRHDSENVLLLEIIVMFP